MRILITTVVSIILWSQASASYASCGGFGPFPFGPHRADRGQCCNQINRVPETISRGGVYCLDRNLETDISSGSAISIEADDVTLDLRGYSLTGTAGVDTNATGIRSEEVARTTVKNGTVRGFRDGINLVHGPSDPVAHIVRGIRADGNTQYGIRADGAGVVIENNLVTHTGGPTASNAWGIEVAGTGYSVKSNVVSGVRTASSGGVGILTLTIGGGAVTGNQVSNAWTGIQATAASGGTGAVNVRDNTVTNSASEMGDKGIDGGFANASLCKDNMVYNFSTAYDNCHNGGGNTSLP